MRWTLGLASLLVVAAVALMLAARSARHTMTAANAPIPSLREGVAPRSFDREAAEAVVTRLVSLADDDVPDHGALEEAAQTAAGWAAGTDPGSPEYHAAVAIRGAADALLTFGAAPDARQRAQARRLLAEARGALHGEAPPPGDAVQRLRDQIKNLEYSQKEKLRDPEAP